MWTSVSGWQWDDWWRPASDSLASALLPPLPGHHGPLSPPQHRPGDPHRDHQDLRRLQRDSVRCTRLLQTDSVCSVSEGGSQVWARADTASMSTTTETSLTGAKLQVATSIPSTPTTGGGGPRWPDICWPEWHNFSSGETRGGLGQHPGHQYRPGCHWYPGPSGPSRRTNVNTGQNNRHTWRFSHRVEFSVIIFHLTEGPDDLGQGGDSGSLKTGNAGARLACCVIRETFPVFSMKYLMSVLSNWNIINWLPAYLLVFCLQRTVSPLTILGCLVCTKWKPAFTLRGSPWSELRSGLSSSFTTNFVNIFSEQWSSGSVGSDEMMDPRLGFVMLMFPVSPDRAVISWGDWPRPSVRTTCWWLSQPRSSPSSPPPPPSRPSAASKGTAWVSWRGTSSWQNTRLLTGLR